MTKATISSEFLLQAGLVRHESDVGALGSDLCSSGLVGRCLCHYLSSRLDLFSAPEAHELADFHLEPEQIDEQVVGNIIHSETGCSPAELFNQLESEPSGVSLRFQWHRATLFSGEQVTIRLVRPDLLTDLPRIDELDRILRRHPGALDPACSRTVVAAFREHLEHSLDLVREADDLSKLGRETDRLALLTAPVIVGDLSTRRCLTTAHLDGETATDLSTKAGPKARQVNERLARRLCRIWLAAALSGAPFPIEPGRHTVQFLAAGRIAFCGGPFHSTRWGARQHLLAFLSSALVGDHHQTSNALVELLQERSESARRRLRHQLRHCDPFRDGHWSSDSDRLCRTVFACWHRAASTGFRARHDLLAFLTGLAHLANTVEELSPRSNAVHQAFQEYRLRECLADFSSFSEGDQWVDVLRSQVQFFSELPRKTNRLLDIEDEGPARRHKTRGRRRESSLIVAGGLVAAMGSAALLVHHFSEFHSAVEPLGSVIVLLAGGLALWSVSGR
jgi:predicted unusual protein kinase regulating ubiquinone biosynthesis (AarF/ABC1/UbiB family)